MTGAEWLALGQRAVKAPGFRWMSGMRLMDGRLVVSAYSDTYGEVNLALVAPFSLPNLELVKWWEFTDTDDDAIDLRDPATLGCVAVLSGVWSTEGSEAEALVAALAI